MDGGRIGEEEKKRGEKQRSNPCCQNVWVIQGREAGGKGREAQGLETFRVGSHGVCQPRWLCDRYWWRWEMLGEPVSVCFDMLKGTSVSLCPGFETQHSSFFIDNNGQYILSHNYFLLKLGYHCQGPGKLGCWLKIEKDRGRLGEYLFVFLLSGVDVGAECSTSPPILPKIQLKFLLRSNRR